MNKRKTSSELKKMAKEQLFGNYGVAAGSFAIIYGMIAVLFTVIIQISMRLMINEGYLNSTQSIAALARSPMYYVTSLVISAIVGALMNTLTVGFLNICLKIARGQKCTVNDLFYCYKRNPDKVILLYLIMYAVGVVLILPSEFISIYLSDRMSGMVFLIWAVFYVIAMVLSVLFSLMAALAFFLYIDDPQMDTLDYIKKSIVLMSGNKGRLFYIMVSMLGWLLAVVFSLGIAAFWVMPYMTVVYSLFYRDVIGEMKEESKIYYVKKEEQTVEGV